MSNVSNGPLMCGDKPVTRFYYRNNGIRVIETESGVMTNPDGTLKEDKSDSEKQVCDE